MDLPDFDAEVREAEAQYAKTIVQKSADSEGDTGLSANEQDDGGPDSAGRPRQELGIFEMSNKKYQLSRGLSSTGIKPAVKSLNLFNETMEGRVPRKETEAMALGSAVHAATLEAYDFGKQVAICRKYGRTNVEKEKKAVFYEENKGMIILTADKYDQCRYMRDSLLNLEKVREIFETGKPEMSGYYIDRTEYGGGTSMLCRIRPDWENGWCVADIKTTVDASREAFSRTIFKFMYHLSAAHYLEGSRILTGQTHNCFAFLCVEPDPPYEAAVYWLGARSLHTGMILRREALNAIKLGRQTDEWPLLNDGVAEEIEIPGYALLD